MSYNTKLLGSYLKYYKFFLRLLLSSVGQIRKIDRVCRGHVEPMGNRRAVFKVLMGRNNGR
jgi:hypothetical protein